ncbi:hypothetical protein I3679_013370 [Proteus mirabilis]|uniref:Uncharacterized protein n=1 Tax=Proteus mirabilis TaxID=584 RepID=A0ABD5LY83_PROMI
MEQPLRGVKAGPPLEVVIFATMGRFCEDYHGGYWECVPCQWCIFIYRFTSRTLTLFPAQ